jgi:hypothetical protein
VVRRDGPVDAVKLLQRTSGLKFVLHRFGLTEVFAGVRFANVQHDEVDAIAEFLIQFLHGRRGTRCHRTAHGAKYKQDGLVGKHITVCQSIAIGREQFKCRNPVTRGGSASPESQIAE